MLKNRSENPTILVTDAGRGSAISIISSIGRKGWNVIAADSDSQSIGFHSKYASERVIYPKPELSPLEYEAAILDAVVRMHVDLVIPVTDASILPLSEARDKFENICQIAMPTEANLEIVTNKLKTLELACRLDVPYPKTLLAQTVQDTEQYIPDVKWPVVMKPQVSRLLNKQAGIEAFTVTYAINPEQLIEKMRYFEGRCPVLLQEYYEGTGYGVELLMDEGEVIAAFQHKRLREVPLTGGASAFRESAELDPCMYDYSVRLLRSLNWTGLAMVEFKVGNEGPKLMEINGRVWGSLPLAVRSGMDFPARLAELYLCESRPSGVSPDTNYHIGTRSRNLQLEVVWIASVLLGRKHYPFLPFPSRLSGLKAIFELFNPFYKFDILNLDDPKPGLAEFPKIIRFLTHTLKEAR
jgi:predicted ATP-grasp superfamily ATP-dependent carboligase